ncbi:M23 family metallopeptidase [Streptomyces sp. I05A-00742]|uniref:M23 family metallopeptidase n=1 Tax=Streptomyces sp. I05A-00742 TaxID=2732853 RepID=UPI001BB12776
MHTQRFFRTLLVALTAVVLLTCRPVAAAGGDVPDRPAAVPLGGDGPRAWPVGTRPAVARAWQPPAARWAPGHRGVDLSAATGQPVLAAVGGVVSFTGTVAGRGVITVELPGTGDPPLRTTYEPVRAGVRRGDRVTAGSALGELEAGPWHCAAGCLHWGLLRGREYLDPLGLLPGWMLRRGPSRLLPLAGGVPRARPFTVSCRGCAPAPPKPRSARLSSIARRAGFHARAHTSARPAIEDKRRSRFHGVRGRAPGNGEGAGPGHSHPQGNPYPPTPRNAIPTATAVTRSGSSTPSSIRRTAESTTP